MPGPASNRSPGRSFFLQFGGQGSPWYRELANLYKEPHLSPLFESAFRILDSELNHVGKTPALPEGLPLKRWLQESGRAPNDAYLSLAAVSIPMIQLLQIAHFEHLRHKGWPGRALLDRTLGATGHSQGIITACWASVLKHKALEYASPEYFSHFRDTMCYQLYLGIRTQDHYLRQTVHPVDEQEAHRNGLIDPSPMAAILGPASRTIECVDAYNESFPSQPIYISLRNSQNNTIISGMPRALLAFFTANKSKFDDGEMRFVFLNTTCPFHCELMHGFQDAFQSDLKRLGIFWDGRSMGFPVYSFADGRDLRQDDRLPQTLAEEIVLKTLNWPVAFKNILHHPDIACILDFGPSKTTQRLTTELYAEQANAAPVFALASSRDMQAFLNLER